LTGPPYAVTPTEPFKAELWRVGKRGKARRTDVPDAKRFHRGEGGLLRVQKGRSAQIYVWRRSTTQRREEIDGKLKKGSKRKRVGRRRGDAKGKGNLH